MMEKITERYLNGVIAGGDRNIYEIDPEEYRKITVLRTVLGGRTVYENEQ